MTALPAGAGADTSAKAPPPVVPLGRYRDTNFITGLRGWAAFGVFLAHSGAGGLAQQGWLAAQFVDLGRFGVDVFFVIAGFSVMTSYAACPDFRTYLIQRLLRIAPLYWCVTGAVFAAYHWGDTYLKIDRATSLNLL
jgi:peptidoglycan/LPS O-acetylase OafA/YrhL